MSDAHALSDGEVLAATAGQDSAMNPQERWLPEPPSGPGQWALRCAENDNVPEELCVFEKNGILWVDCPTLGVYPLSRYHAGLSNVFWKHTVGSSKPAP